LLGYSYAHLLSNKTSPRSQGKIHAILLFTSLGLMIFLWTIWGSPLTPGTRWSPQPGDNPVWKILELLAVTVAFPFFLLSSTASLLQKSFSLTYRSKSPYWLYALSNAGSLLGLFSYPVLVEWAFDVTHQARMWSAGYALFAVL